MQAVQFNYTCIDLPLQTQLVCNFNSISYHLSSSHECIKLSLYFITTSVIMHLRSQLKIILNILVTYVLLGDL